MAADRTRVLLVGAIGVLIVLSAVPAMAQTEPGSVFVDDDRNVHELDIEFIHAAGITKGCNPPVNDRYCPQLPVTRAQLASFMARSFDLPRSSTDHFTDDAGSVHQADINAIADAGFVFGCGADLYCPDDNVTRAQLASVFVRAYGLGRTATDYFVDDNGSVHEADINALAEAGLTVGCNAAAAAYCPLDPVRRDQFSSFLARALRLAINEPPIAQARSVDTQEDSAVSIILTGVDEDEDSLEFVIVADPTHGTLTGTAPNLVYVPDTNFFGDDGFSFTVSDGEFTSSAATVAITVTPVNDAPVLAPIADVLIAELGTVTLTATADDADLPADTLTFSIDAASTAAGMTIDAQSGVFSWTPSETQGPAAYTVTVTVTDNGLPSRAAADTFQITVGEVNTPPVAADLTYEAVGNVGISVPAVSGLLSGAADADLPAQTLSISSYAATTTGGGSVTVVNSATGAFTYTPAPGFVGADTFTYAVADDGPGTLISNQGTVTVTVTDLIWFIDNTATGTNQGTLQHPFQTVGAFNGATLAGPGDGIYLAGTGTDYAAGVVLDDGQKLIGEGTSELSLAAALGITLPPYSEPLPTVGGVGPRINTTDTGVTLGADNEVRGLAIVTSGSVGLAGSAVGGLIVDDIVSVTTQGAPAIVLSGGVAADVAIDAVTVVDSPTGGISLTSLSGTTNLSGLDLKTTGGTGFAASAAGTINVTGSSNLIDADAGTALSFTGGTTIGTSGATFESISAVGGPAGIVLDGTGSEAFAVTGDGPSDPADLTRGRTTIGVGGAIARDSGGTITDTTGDSIQLTATSNVTLGNLEIANTGAGSRRGITASGGTGLIVDNVKISGFSDEGLHAEGLVGLTITHSEVVSNAKSADSVANEESNLALVDVAGTVLVDNSIIRDVSRDNIRVSSCESGPCGGAALDITFDNVLVRDTLSEVGGNGGVVVRSFNDAAVFVTVTNSEIVNNREVGIEHSTAGSASGSTTVTNSVLYGNGVSVSILHDGSTHDFSITGNSIRAQLGGLAHEGSAVAVQLGDGSTPGSLLAGTIAANTVGNGSIADSGSLLGHGIDLAARGAGTLSANVTGNTVWSIKVGSAFHAASAGHSGTLNVTAKSNTFDVAASSGPALAGLDLFAGSAATDTGTVCADITGNTSFVGAASWAGAYLTTSAGAPLVELVGYTGATNDIGAIESFLDAAASSVSPPASGSGTSAVSAGAVSGRDLPCPQP